MKHGLVGAVLTAMTHLTFLKGLIHPQLLNSTSHCRYCHHTSTLFPTWHRVEMWHFEQQLIRTARTIAASFVNPSERAIYLRVAEMLRLPYWDWANTYLAE